MFRNFIYLDEDKVLDYSSVINGGYSEKTAKAVSKKLSGKANLGVVSAQAEIGSSSETEPRFTPSIIYDYFEKDLTALAGEEFFDFLSSDSFDIRTLPPMSLFRLRGQIEIPEGFDSLAMIRQYAPMLERLGQLNMSSDEVPTEFIMDILGQSKVDIPIIIRNDEITLSGKLKTQFIEDADYQRLEDLEEGEAILLCKVVAYSSKQIVPIYDPLKDFMKLNRAMRRTSSRTKELSVISTEGPVLKVEVIAIYH